MLELLALAHGERVLEIGTGSGYNAALLAELVGRLGLISTVDLDDDIVENARQRLVNAGYRSVRTRCVDGTLGDPESGLFDAIVATAGIGDIPLAWMSQMRIGGRLVVPLVVGVAQRVVRFERTPDGLKSTSIIGGEFMTLRGPSAAASIGVLSTLSDPAIRLRTLVGNAIDVDALTRALRGRYADIALTNELTVGDVWESLDLWLSAHELTVCRLTAQGEAARRGFVPDSMIIGSAAAHGLAATLGLCHNDELVVFVLAEGVMRLRAFGGSTCKDRLERAIVRWIGHGRPGNTQLRITASLRSKSAEPPNGSAHQEAYGMAGSSVNVFLESSR